MGYQKTQLAHNFLLVGTTRPVIRKSITQHRVRDLVLMVKVWVRGWGKHYANEGPN